MTAEERAQIVVDLAAIRHNVARLREVAGVPVMVVVKADAYGHGMVPAARAAREAGATWLGVASLDEAVALRAAGDEGRLLAWLVVPGEDWAPAIAADVDVTAYDLDHLEAVAEAVAVTGRPARLQLKVDTGLSRGGARREEWAALVAAARAGEVAGTWRVTGIWSHLACSDEPEHPANARQEAAFREALAVADDAGLRPEVRHLANSAGALLLPSTRFDLVRCGLAAYGLDPAPGRLPAGVDLRPAMTVRARLALVKPIAAGDAVSYGHTWTAAAPTVVGLLPVGYAEGVPRAAGNRAEVTVAGRRAPVRGVVCMDQLVVDLGPEAAEHAGEDAVLIGPAPAPTAQEWAGWCDTISYEIVTRLGGRFARRHVDSAPASGTAEPTEPTTEPTTEMTTEPASVPTAVGEGGR
ncbi:alanine racemase [Nocardioides sp. TRM66260-LWL]|uniref:alanine racemase n=1 Tax=Nocardioides sp. TRM66260-LWL TaxID=2874478 RepID=UPI001CC7140F|nr:alanine racemase [Nocardioides sp. TRM66260-LWL]MBZ5736080.1 alanine racemase [Nocardioides sp. TRM66260-LWL]